MLMMETEEISETLASSSTSTRLIAREKFSEFVGFEVLTAVVMKSIIFWDMTPCNLLSCNRRFGGNIASNFRVEEIISARTSKQAELANLFAVKASNLTNRDFLMT
jgi:hypothetical protein